MTASVVDAAGPRGAGSTDASNLPGGSAELTGKRVLVVEDKPPASPLLDELRDAGAEVLSPAASVDHTLRLVEAAAYDGGLSAAVLDINPQGKAVAPAADGLAALGVPFLFATGYGLRGTGRRAAAPVPRKPFSPRALVVAVEALASP